MPTYEYKCEGCGKQSVLYLTLAEHESGAVKCPACGSTKMRQLVSAFYAQTSKKS